MKILITGGNGQLGNSIRKVSSRYPDHTYLFTDVEDLNITSKPDLETFFKKFSPDFCINCAGYTSVDKAEEDKENAYRLNSEAVKLLGHITDKYNCKFIHISTDYVFSGQSWKPYDESDKPDANSVYGISKLEGEKAIMNMDHVIILRTSWLYSEFGFNFLKTMIKLMKEKEELKVVFDQVGTPTYATDLASGILEIISASGKGKYKNGIYHYSNEGVSSWYDFSKEIGSLTGFEGIIIPVDSSEFPRPAPRPPYSVLNKSKIKEVYKLNIPYWKESLENCYSSL